MKDYFWNLFKNTGNIEAYLAYKDIENHYSNKKEGDRIEQAESSRDCY